MRVMLIYSNRTQILEPAPPIGLSYVASAAKNAGHDVEFVDLLFGRDPEKRLRHAINRFHPDVIGISVRNIDNIVPQQLAWHLGEVVSFISLIRSLTCATLVVGGPGVSALGAASLERLDADFAILGEGEVAFPLLLERLENKKELSDIAGLVYRDEGGVRANPPVRHEHFGSSGMEAWIDWRVYERNGGAFAVHTKRGCPLHCLYCNYPSMEGRKLRCRSASEIVDEIERIKKTLNPRTFEFTDSTFNIPSEHAENICKEIIRRKLRVKLSAVGINPAGVSEELFSLMKEAGFISMVITADSACETMLHNLKKGFSVDRVRRTAELARNSGIPSTWFFLLGGPGETMETVDQTVSFAEQHLNWKDCLTIFMTGLRILPGTALARHAVEQGLMEEDRDLAKPAFYLSPEVSEEWILSRINQAIARCPAFVHGGEENGSLWERAFYRLLHWAGAAPPYLRFLPRFLRTPPLPMLRTRYPGVKPSRIELFLSPCEQAAAGVRDN